MGTPLRVLVVENSDGDADALLRELRRGGYDPESERVDSLRSLESALVRDEWDLVLVNYGMTGFSGLSAVTRVREKGLDLPCIVISGTPGEDVATAVMKAGAQGYVLKSSPTLLAPIVREELLHAAVRRKSAQARETRSSTLPSLTALMGSLPGMAYRCRNDRNWTMEYVSEGAITLTGYPPEDLVDNRKVSFGRLIHADDQERVWAEVQEALRNRRAYQLVYRIRTALGDEKWVWEQGGGLFSSGWKLEGLEGFITDITERRNTEEALRKIGEEILDIYNNAPCGYHSLDKDGVFVRINDTELSWLGRTRDEVVGKMKFSEIIPPGAAKTFIESFALLKEGTRAQELEYEIVRKDGTLMPVLLSATAVQDAKGDYVMSRATLFDITLRKRAEMQREALLRLSQGLAGASSVRQMSRVMADESRRLFRHDAFMLDLQDETSGLWTTAVAEDTAPGHAEPDVFEGTSSPRSASDRNPAFRGLAELINRMEAPAVTDLVPFGYVKRLSRSLMFVPIRWEGRLIGTLSVQSYTPGRYTQEDLKLLQAFADQCGGALARLRAQEALRESADKLRQSQKMEAVGRLAGGIAHDFNNLLTVILGHGKLLAKDLKETGPIRGHIDEILAATVRASGLTRQLLAFSRKQILEPTILSVYALIGESENMLRSLMGEQVELAMDLDAATGNIRADAGQIEQVLMNLAANARDAMPRGGRVTLKVANEDVAGHAELPPGPYVVITFADTGSGMDAETQAHIFEPFFTSKEKGTGLGLSGAYGIVKQSGGHIAVESAVGRGATFRVYLPRVAEEVAPHKTGSSVFRTPLGSETILLVEDSEVVRRLSREILHELGYTVVEARDGEDALRVAGAHKGPIHILLTDVVMPLMGGRELVSRLAPARPHMRVLLMSGHPEGDFDGDALPPGAGFLSKPFTPAALARKIRETLDTPPNEKA